MSSNSYVPPREVGAGLDNPVESITDVLETTQHHTNAQPAGGSANSVLVVGSMQHDQEGQYVDMGAIDGVWRFDNNEGDDEDGTADGSSVLTKDGIHDVTGFCIVCFVILIGDMSRGVMFPTMWPLVSELGGSTVTLGYAVAAFSFGRIIVSPVFGSWSELYGYSKVLILSTFILLCGTLVYAQAQNVGSPSFLIFAQTLLGVGSGTLGVTRAFVAEVTATRTRTRYMALITAVQYGGFTVTPFAGVIFIKVLGDSDYQFGLFRLNMYTAPAYFMATICAITLGLLVTLFQDRSRLKAQSSKKKSARRTAIDDYAHTTTRIGLTTYDICILGCMLLNVATKGSIASFETMGISYAASDFDISPALAGTYVATCGTVGVIALLSMGYFAAHFTDIQLISGGILVMVTGIISLVPTGHDPEENSSWRYVFAIFMVYAIGYPIGHTALLGLFSKIVGRRPQGLLMGWFAAAGSLARILFPVMSGYVASVDIKNLFIILSSILSVSALFVVMSRKTLTLLSS